MYIYHAIALIDRMLSYCTVNKEVARFTFAIRQKRVPPSGITLFKINVLLHEYDKLTFLHDPLQTTNFLSNVYI